MTHVAINGFGRIGRLALRIGLLKHHGDIEFVAINTSGSMEVDGWAHLVNQDTTYRKFSIEIVAEKVKNAKEATDEDPLIGYLSILKHGWTVSAFMAPTTTLRGCISAAGIIRRRLRNLCRKCCCRNRPAMVPGRPPMAKRETTELSIPHRWPF